jgi:hypothetical protein
MKDIACIKQHLKGMEMMKPMMIRKKHEGAISEIGKQLTMWMVAQLQKCIPLSFMTIQAKARS